MKTLQNNFTTPEQSKRLLELGLPADSADCVRVVRTDLVFFMQHGKVTKDYLSLYKSVRGEEAEPCWSVGRLIEIYELLMGIPFTRYNLKMSLLDEVLERYAQNIVCMNFSKLEE